MTQLAIPPDSDRRCPRCVKRMFVEVGQDDVMGAGRVEVWHHCWSCDYRERDTQWRVKRGA